MTDRAADRARDLDVQPIVASHTPTIEAGIVIFAAQRWSTDDGKVGWMLHDGKGWRTATDAEIAVLEVHFVRDAVRLT